MMNELKLAYVTLQNDCGIKVGDTVKVLKKASSRQWGWHNSWVGEMDEFIGNSYEVRDVNANGIKLSDDIYEFPFFVLEKIHKPHWRDTVSPENPVLCYVRDDSHKAWSEGCLLVTSFDNSQPYPYDTEEDNYKYANRAPKSMIESMLKAYDETSEDE